MQANGDARQVEETYSAVNETAVFVEYFTDPLCSWSWAFEAQWRRLRYECAGRLSWRYRMGGLIADWQSYNDPFNDIRNPAQMGPQWLQVHEMSGMPLDERIWQSDPPASSYPACIAVKAAERQGQATVEVYLRRLREAAMMERRNIAHRDILLAVAEQTACDSAEGTALDLDRFSTDLYAPETVEAFRQDLRDAAYYGIGRFPTLIFRQLDGRGIVLVGYRPYEVLCDALEHLAPGLRLSPQLPQEDLAVAYVRHWHRVTARELSEVPGITPTESTVLLKSLVAKGRLMQVDDSQSETPIYVPTQGD